MAKFVYLKIFYIGMIGLLSDYVTFALEFIVSIFFFLFVAAQEIYQVQGSYVATFKTLLGEGQFHISYGRFCY